MGLDMFLMKKIPGQEKMEEIGYWRKANAIHGWFENHSPNGVDNLEDIHVTKDMLKNLKRDCEMVLKGNIVEGKVWSGQRMQGGKCEDIWIDGEVLEDSSLAEEILPTTQGFFFGSQQYGQWYIEDLKETIRIVDKALANTNFDTEKLYYYAWW